MLRYLVRKSLGWLLMIAVATNLTYFLANFFLDPRANYLQLRPPRTPERINLSLDQYNLSPETRFADRLHQSLSIITLNTPMVVAGLAVVLLAIALNQSLGTTLLFVAGAQSPGVSGFWPLLVDRLQHLVPPTVALVVTSYAVYHMLQRALLLDNINSDYVRMARPRV